MGILKRRDKKRFMEYVSVNPETNCWEWDGVIRTGYGRFYLRGKWLSAHRASWELHNDAIPEGLLVLHKCDNKCCVNPEHLFVGTQRDNVRDMWEKKRAKVLRGSSNPNSKLMEADVKLIRDLYEEGETSYAKLAREFSVSPKLIELVVKRQVWRQVM
jgi:hypothetical protein